MDTRAGRQGLEFTGVEFMEIWSPAHLTVLVRFLRIRYVWIWASSIVDAETRIQSRVVYFKRHKECVKQMRQVADGARHGML